MSRLLLLGFSNANMAGASYAARKVQRMIQQVDEPVVLEWMIANPASVVEYSIARMRALQRSPAKSNFVAVQYLGGKAERLPFDADDTVEKFMKRNKLGKVYAKAYGAPVQLDPGLTCAEAGFFAHGSISFIVEPLPGASSGGRRRSTPRSKASR